MKRRTGVAALAVAAVVGCGAGAYVAVTFPGPDQGTVISSGADATATAGPPTDRSSTSEQDALNGSGAADGAASGPSGSADHDGPDSASRPQGGSERTPDNPEGKTDSAGPAPLFYFADDRIRDQDHDIPVDLPRSWPISSLQRAGNSWLIVQQSSGSDDQQKYRGTVVYADGSQWDLGRLGVGWDVTSDGTVLFSSGSGTWVRADPRTRKVTEVKINNSSGDRLPVMDDTEPKPWIQQTRSGVLTGWKASDGPHLVRSDLAHGDQTEVGSPGIRRPNTSPDGDLAVGDSVGDSVGDDADGDEDGCLTGGPVDSPASGSQSDDSEADGTGDWWHNCDFRRLSSVSPYSPNGRRLLTVPRKADRSGLGEFDLLDARTGDPTYMIDTPDWTYAGAWADNETLTVLARPNGHNRKRTEIYRVGLGGDAELIDEVTGTVVLGTP